MLLQLTSISIENITYWFLKVINFNIIMVFLNINPCDLLDNEGLRKVCCFDFQSFYPENGLSKFLKQYCSPCKITRCLASETFVFTTVRTPILILNSFNCYIYLFSLLCIASRWLVLPLQTKRNMIRLRGALLKQRTNIFIETQGVPIINFKYKNHKTNSSV
jgi:hypothetical protein